MAEYIYDLEADSRYVLEDYRRPIMDIPVYQGDEQVCLVDFTEPGIVVMDIPRYIVEELLASRARILAWSELDHRPQEIGSETRINLITHFEIVV